MVFKTIPDYVMFGTYKSEPKLIEIDSIGIRVVNVFPNNTETKFKYHVMIPFIEIQELFYNFDSTNLLFIKPTIESNLKIQESMFLGQNSTNGLKFDIQSKHPKEHYIIIVIKNRINKRLLTKNLTTSLKAQNVSIKCDAIESGTASALLESAMSGPSGQQRTQHINGSNNRKTGLKRKQKTITDFMEDILQNGIHSDVEIVVSGHKFSAHKAILTARSPVFAAMFEHPMKERELNRVDINDIDKEVFAKLLRFIYTDKVCNEDIDSNIKLFCLADKYNLDDLKTICEKYISTQIKAETVSEVLILADTHSAQELKQKAINFIKNNSIKVMKTNEWKKIIDRKDLLNLF